MFKLLLFLDLDLCIWGFLIEWKCGPLSEPLGIVYLSGLGAGGTAEVRANKVQGPLPHWLWALMKRWKFVPSAQVLEPVNCWC